MANILDSTEWNISIIRIVPMNSTVVGDKSQAGQLNKQKWGPFGLRGLQQGWEPWVGLGLVSNLKEVLERKQ